jgi:hypothetical protein
MSESIIESIDHQLRTNERTSPLSSRPTLLRKGLAGLFGFLLMGATVAPVQQNWRPRPKDNFPFSYYPMFSEKRGAVYVVNYMVGLDAHGNRSLISFKFAGSGGFNQTRRQINRLVRERKADKLCQAVASGVGREVALPYSEIVTVRIVTGRFRFADYFGGNKAPLKERVDASCQVVRGELTKDGADKGGAGEEDPAQEDQP